MDWRLWLVVLLLVASCASPEPPDAWAVHRVAPTDEVEEPAGGVCDDIRTLALGSHADETTLDGTLEELARLAAVTGATAALPLLSDIGTLVDDPTVSDRRRAVQQHDLMVLASRAIDDATSTVCGLPGFSALYATSGFPDCHFEMEIPIAAYTTPSTPGQCTTEGRPSFLPCWSDDGDHLAVDCVTDEIVTAVGDRWASAGPPRDVRIDRTDPDETPGPEVIRPNASTECRQLTALFRTAPLPNGNIPDFDALDRAAAGLDADVRSQIDQFVDATISPPSFNEFETLVSALDDATATACGFPLVSAWASITTPLTALPCWLPTGVPYPAYEIAGCTT
jgi:hypothetical protein